MSEARLEAAISLGRDDRLRIVDRFFDTFPGTPEGPPGQGMAIVDFVGWLVGSGRLDDTAGSPWWKALNGSLLLDLADVLDSSTVGCGPDGAGASSWRAYADGNGHEDPADLQSLFWHAHQCSLHSTIPRCQGLLAAEPVHERELIGMAIEIVDLSALRTQPTDTPALGMLTRQLYPDHYPLVAPCRPELRRLRSAAMRLHPGPEVGLGSRIWPDARRQAS